MDNRKSDIVKCSNCGSELKEGARFCGVCGVQFSPEHSEPISPAGCKICPNCGTGVKYDATFCGVCGYSFVTLPPKEGNRYEEPPRKRSKLTVVLVSLILILVLAVSGLATYIYITFNAADNEEKIETRDENKEKDDEDDDDRKTPKPGRDDDDKDEDDDEDKKETPIPSPSLAPEKYDDFLFPSDTEYITEADLNGKTQQEVAFIRNEIYARRGYVFTTEPYITYFSEKDWYTPDPTFDGSTFNEIESANKTFIIEYEKKKGWR